MRSLRTLLASAAVAVLALGVSAAPSLADESGDAALSGNAFYADHATPIAGVEVVVAEFVLSGQTTPRRVFTDEAGHWDVGSVAPGKYRITFFVNVSTGSPSNRVQAKVAEEVVTITGGDSASLSTLLEGPKPEGTIEVKVLTAEGWYAEGLTAWLLYPDGGRAPGYTDGSGPARLFAPTGTYALEVESPGTSPIGVQLMDGGAATSVSVTDGRVSEVTITLPALALPPGATPAGEQRLLDWLNTQRSRWGLPGGLTSVPLWSRGCAAHDNYLALGRTTGHFEYPTAPGYSAGGDWAGQHSALAYGGASWSAEGNPWMDAPFHLAQLFAPWLTRTGLDDSHGHQCAITWPGMNWSIAPPGTVWTFPGAGTAGVPPVELASESPTTPNEILGLPARTGRQLFVYQQLPDARESIRVKSASLTSAEGPAAVRWMDSGNLSPGAIIIPVQPLRPWTRYTASVTIETADPEEVIGFPATTYSWSFSTGANNPSGEWAEGRRKASHRRIQIRYRGGSLVVRGWHFTPGRVMLKRRVDRPRRRPHGHSRAGWRRMRRAQVHATGRFTAKFRWKKTQRIVVGVYQKGRRTVGAYHPQRKHRHGSHRAAPGLTR